MASSQSNTSDAYETSSNDKTVKNSESDKLIKTPQVILNDSVKNPIKMSNSQTINTEFQGQKSGANSFLNAPKQSSPNSLQVSQMPIGSATGNPRNKIALRPGYSLMDWIRLTKTPGKNLSGVDGRYRNVTTTELKQHSTKDDAWMAINGLVFNVTGSYHSFWGYRVVKPIFLPT